LFWEVGRELGVKQKKFAHMGTRLLGEKVLKYKQLNKKRFDILGILIPRKRVTLW